MTDVARLGGGQRRKPKCAHRFFLGLDNRPASLHICTMTQFSKRHSGEMATCCKNLRRLLSPKLFKALCDPNRISILVRLAECCSPCTVSEIAGCCPINLSVVSRHLAQLREAGILLAQKRGKEVRYSLRSQELVQTLRSIADAIERCCAGPARQAPG
jgi:ArsR family transcriptional regulator, arsenate/arsenite/antimonite-responsive transcriptional repressor